MKLPVMSHCYTHTYFHCVQHHSSSPALSSLFRDSSTCTSKWQMKPREKRKSLCKRSDLSSQSTRTHAHTHTRTHARTHTLVSLLSLPSADGFLSCVFALFFCFQLFLGFLKLKVTFVSNPTTST